MKLFDVLSEDAVYNTIAHCKKCWDYTYPTGKALEEAIYRGIKPFYKNTRSLGAPNTIVDVSKETDAFDIKGGKKLGHLKKLSKSANDETNIFVEQILPNALKIKIKIPKNITTMVQRPNVDMKNWKGDPLRTIKASISFYKNFANTTTKKANCDNLFSIIMLYGEDEKKGYRSLFITLENFSEPEIATATHYLKKDGSYAGYNGFDKDGNLIYSLSPFNRGSVNSYKRFDTNQGVLYTWPIEENNPTIYDEAFLLKDGAIKIVK
jgi:hypothetical protein